MTVSKPHVGENRPGRITAQMKVNLRNFQVWSFRLLKYPLNQICLLAIFFELLTWKGDILNEWENLRKFDNIFIVNRQGSMEYFDEVGDFSDILVTRASFLRCSRILLSY